MAEYIDMKEAIAVTGKSEKTIRTAFKNAPKQYIKPGRPVQILKSYILEIYPANTGSDTGSDTGREALIKQLQSENQFLKQHLENITLQLRIEQLKTLSESDKQILARANPDELKKLLQEIKSKK